MSKYYKAITVTVASVTAVYLVGNSSLKEKKLNASWTNNYEPSVKWNANWDRRDPASLMKPKHRHFSSQNSEANKENQPNDANKTVDDFEVNKHSSKATRHLFLIRHGQYEVKANEAHKMILTQLGILNL
jgi:serine/threonine-protein phosphatase PGAM5